MIRFTTRRRPNSVVAPAIPALVQGWNAAFAMNFIGKTGALDRIADLKGSHPMTLRFPGGSLGNFTHPQDAKGYGVRVGEQAHAPGSVVAQWDTDQAYPAGINYMPLMVSTALAAGVKVMWMGNLFTGTTTELLYALNEFITGGVEVIGVELGCEWYLKAYESVYPTHAEYITQAKTFRDAIKAVYPDMPCGIVVGPSADMKDADSSSASSLKISAGNTAIRLLDWPDAVIIHSYVTIDDAIDPYNSIRADAKCAEHRVALLDHVASFSKQVWLTEWNVHGVDWGVYGSTTQVNHYTAMIALIEATPQIVISHCHNLLAYGSGYNAISASGGSCTLNTLGTTAAALAA